MLWRTSLITIHIYYLPLIMYLIIIIMFKKCTTCVPRSYVLYLWRFLRRRRSDTRYPSTQTSYYLAYALSGFRPKIIPVEDKNPMGEDRTELHEATCAHLNVPVINHGPVERSATTCTCSKSILQKLAIAWKPRKGSFTTLFQC